MLKKFTAGLSMVLVLTGAALAQKVYTPEKGSAERSAILDALRVPVEKKLKQKIQFNVDTFKVQGDWAFVYGAPQNTAGETPNYQNTVYQRDINEGLFDNNFQALLKKTKGKWKVVVFAIGCTDVCYLGWDKEYKAPKGLFSYSE